MRKELMPQFCKKCANVRMSLFSREDYCKQICKFNPRFQFAASHSYFFRKRGAGVS